MVKDILVLGEIYSYTVAWFFEQITAALKDEPTETELTLRVNTTGGSPEYGMSIIEKVQESLDQFTSVKVAGQAHSMGLFLLCYFPVEKVEVLDTTQAILHRPAWPAWMEASESFKDSAYEACLFKCIKDVEKVFRNRVNIEAFEALPQMKEKNLKTKDIFSTEKREEVLLSGADLKKIGIAGKVNTVTPKKAAEMSALIEQFNKCGSLEEYRIAAKKIGPEKEEENKNDNSKLTNMTLAELKAQNLALYNEVFALGATAGAEQERDRVGAVTVFMEIDPVACKAIIASGKPMTQTQQSEFLLKATTADHLAKVKKDSEKVADTAKPGDAETIKAAALLEFEKDLDKQLGIVAKAAPAAEAVK